MVATPIVFMAAMGVQSRTFAPNYQFVQGDAAHEAKVYAYLQPFKRAKASIIRLDTPSLVNCRTEARQWVNLSKKGLLTPIEPVAYEDSPTEGPKGQLVRMVQLMSSVLAWGARQERDAGNIDQSVKDAVLGIQIAQVLKYSDFQTLSAMGMCQRRGIGILMETLPQCNAVQRQYVLEALEQHVSARPILAHLSRSTRAQYREHQLRQGVDPVTIQETDRVVSVESGLSLDASPEVIMKQLRHATLAAANAEGAPEFLSFARVGYMSEVETNRRLAELLQQIKKA